MVRLVALFLVGTIVGTIAGALFAGAPALARTHADADADADADAAVFRIRGDIAAPLNADSDWLAGQSEQAKVEADRPFRIRMEAPAIAREADLALEYRRNGGEWTRLEAHDFPYPEREVALDFAGMTAELTVGQAEQGWRVIRAAPASLTIARTGSESALRVSSGDTGFAAIYPLPWPAAPDVGLSARLSMSSAPDGFSFLLGYRDEANHAIVQIDPHGRIALISVIGGAAQTIGAAELPMIQQAWHELEFAAEAGNFTLEWDGKQVLSLPFAALSGQPGLAIPPGAMVEFAELEFEGVARTPQVSIISTPAYRQGDPTTDLLAGSDAPFIAGAGISLAELVPFEGGAKGHSEFEWPLVIRRYSDGPMVGFSGDIFEFRMVDGAGDPFDGAENARVILEVPPGHLGGTFVETPGRIGPWKTANGDLYFIMEPSETDNKFMMMKSVDAGRSWTEMDGANRPETGDLEAVDARLEEGVIHILHQVTHSVRYHTFHTSDHPLHRDSWGVRDEVAARADAVAQMATMVRRSDGSLVAVFLADRLHYVIGDGHGHWSEPIALGPLDGTIDTGPQALLGDADQVHLAYASADGRIWYRTLESDGTLTPRLLLAEGAGSGRPVYGAVLALVRDQTSGEVTIAYRLADGSLWERTRQSDGSFAPPLQITALPVVTDAVDSQQAGADLVMTGQGPVVLFIDEASRSIYCTQKRGLNWAEPRLLISGIEGSWIRGQLVSEDPGKPTIGFVYDAGSKGGTGLNRYATASCMAQ